MKNSVKQSKFDGPFDHKLEISDLFIKQFIPLILESGVQVRQTCDLEPFINKDGVVVRYCDAELISKNGKRFFMEFKDFSSTYKRLKTGLPIDYVEKISKVTNNGRDVYLIFRNNDDFFSKRVEYIMGRSSKSKKESQSIVWKELYSLGFVRKINEKMYHVPYGNRLDVLMDNANTPENVRLRDIIPSHFYLNKPNGKEARQYLWDLSIMKPMHELMGLEQYDYTNCPVIDRLSINKPKNNVVDNSWRLSPPPFKDKEVEIKGHYRGKNGSEEELLSDEINVSHICSYTNNWFEVEGSPKYWRYLFHRSFVDNIENNGLQLLLNKFEYDDSFCPEILYDSNREFILVDKSSRKFIHRFKVLTECLDFCYKLGWHVYDEKSKPIVKESDDYIGFIKD